MSPKYYSSLQQNDEECVEKLLPVECRDDYAGSSDQSRHKRKFWSKYWAWFTHGALVCSSTMLFVMLIQARSQPIKFTVYSPANVAVEYNKEVTTFNGTFEMDSIYRGKPSPELDAAWSRVGIDVPPTRLTLEELKKIGKTDSPSIVKFHEEDGGGYMASVEVFHQLHCLNLLRKNLHHEYYYKTDISFTSSKQETFKTHVDHCIEIIRQSLMCSADVGIVTYEWVRGFKVPYPNFNTKHQCRNFDKILAWAYENSFHIPHSRFGNVVDLVDAP